MQRRPSAALALALAVALVVFSACSDGDDTTATSETTEALLPPIRLGAIFNMTGPNSTLGQEEFVGVEAAVAEINRQGGVLGRQLELVKADAASDPQKAATEATRLMDDEDVVAIIGPDGAQTALPIVPVANERGVPLVAASAGFLARVAPEQLSWVFTVGPDFATRGLPTFVRYWQSKGYRRVAVLSNQTPVFELVNGFLTTTASEAGFEVVGAESFPTGQPDVTPLIAKLAGRDPDVLLVPHVGADVATVIKNFRTLAPEGIEITTNAATANRRFIDLVGEQAMEGVVLNGWKAMVVDDLATDDPVRPEVDRYRKGVEAQGLTWDPASSAIVGWDGVQVVARALEEAGRVDRAALRDALERVDFQGAMTHWRFTADEHDGAPAGEVWVMVQRVAGGWKRVDG
ncbi:MAG: ABC transporter substrate-binding protein [Acidimicrobiia bacterium]